LLAIRNGQVAYPVLLEMAGALQKEVEAALTKSPLPKQPDQKAAQQLLMELIKERVRV